MRSGGREPRQRAVARHPDLPQNEVGGGIDAAPVEHELAGLEVLTAVRSGIDAEVRVETIRGGNSWLHVGRIAFSAGQLDGLVRRPGEYAGMAVEGSADALAGPNLAEHGVDHFPIGLEAGLALAVVALQAADVWIHLREPQLHDAIGYGRENNVRLLDVASGQRR